LTEHITCVAVCPSKSVDIEGFTEQQIYAQVESLLEIS
jgi:heterodisulfide reductase subunit A-like polyferredoxin